MKCPHCNYEHGYNLTKDKDFNGSKGNFYELPIKMERDGYDFRLEKAHLYGCPECEKLFIRRFL